MIDISEAEMSSSELQHVRILGTKIFDVNPLLFLQWLSSQVESKDGSSSGRFVVFRDVHGVVRARNERALAAAHEASLMSVPDGMPLVWLGRALGLKNVARVCGPDTMLEVCRFGVPRGWRHFLYGGTPDVLRTLEASLKLRFPGIEIVGLVSPPFRSLACSEQDQFLSEIRNAKPDLVWVGLGSPKQETWMAQHASEIPHAICLGVGAAFDMHAGRIKRAPVWMRQTGMEWIYRIVQEPKRLSTRYAATVPHFLALIAGALIRRELAAIRGTTALGGRRRAARVSAE